MLAPAGYSVARAARPRAALCARRQRVLVALRSTLALARSWRPAFCAACGWRGAARRLRAGRIEHAAFRRQLELARADMVPAELSADRGARALPSFLRRHAARRVPHWFGDHDEPGRSGVRAVAAHRRNFSSGWG